MIAAHVQRTTLHIVECVPPHEARAGDPHYASFRRARARLAANGLLRCWIGNADCAGEIELHHDKVEFSLQSGIDVAKLDQAFGLHLDDAAFADWVNSEGNLLPLCRLHHIGIQGIHVLPYPVWLPQKFYRDGMAAPAHVEALPRD